MNRNILVIEDEPAINDLICMNLEVAGYMVTPFLDGEKASAGLARHHEYDCALVDIMLPGKDGFALLPELKNFNIPVIFLTAKADVGSKVKGLKDGAEDYIVKPFEMLELLVRLEKVLERHMTQAEVIQIGDVKIDPQQRKVMKNGTEVYLKPMEYDCLMMFVRYQNKALTREQLLAGLWGQEFEGETRTVDAHVGRIRKKLDWQDVIKTIPKIGYRLEVEE
ncbi:MAG: response regulator transcription factor [Lachnospiraceae bacterium]|nr:response regulator transcription factor [Lachnospiraceae bacterium]